MVPLISGRAGTGITIEYGTSWQELSGYTGKLLFFYRKERRRNREQILTPDETYAITAYLLYSNMIVDDDFVLSHENFTEVEMPNVDGFIVDDREETEYGLFSQEPCMENCKDDVQITSQASSLDVTPEDGGTLMD